MATGATGQLGLALPVQGELSGTWGDTVNNGITQYINIAVAGTLTLTGDGAVTLANTTGDASASNITSTLAGAGTVTAQFSTVRVSGTTTTKVVTGPSYSKSYLIDNASSYAVTFKASGQTGVSISPGEKVYVYYNATDYVKVGGGGITYGAVKTTTYTAVANDGVLTNTTGGAFTVNLPASPATGTQVFIADANGTWGTNNLTIGRNGSTIAGSATDLVCDINSVSIQCVYTGTTWDIFAQIGANDTAVVTLTGTQTLTNKTLTSPTITSPTVTGMVVSDGTANGVTYLNGSKVLTSGSALVFDGTNLGVGVTPTTVLHTLGANTSVATTLVQSASYAKLRFQSHSGSSLSAYQGVVDSGTTWYTQIANGGGTGSYNMSFNPFGASVLIGTTDGSLGGKLITVQSSGDVSNFYSTDAFMAGQIIAIRADRNTTNNTFYAIGYYNTGAAAYKFRVADSGAIATAGSISLGTVTPATSGVGVQFPATQSASSNANTLDDYEEGTWTPTDGSSASLTFTNVSGTYTKIGRNVVAVFSVTYPTTSSTAQASITGLPFQTGGASGVTGGAGGGIINYQQTSTAAIYLTLEAAGGTKAFWYTTGGTGMLNATFTGAVMVATLVYQTST
jgi:hypothetical protein